MSLRIRGFELIDLDAVLKIERECFDRDTFDREIFLEFYTKEPYGFFVAEEENKIIGYIITSVKRSENIISIAVLPEYREKGIGGSLLKKGLEILKSYGIRNVKLMVRETNTVARDFYKKYKFQEMGIVKKYYGDENALLMCKII